MLAGSAATKYPILICASTTRESFQWWNDIIMTLVLLWRESVYRLLIPHVIVTRYRLIPPGGPELHPLHLQEMSHHISWSLARNWNPWIKSQHHRNYNLLYNAKVKPTSLICHAQEPMINTAHEKSFLCTRWGVDLWTRRELKKASTNVRLFLHSQRIIVLQMALRISANHDNVKNGHVKKIVDAALFLNNESEWHDIHFKVNYSLKK